MITLPWPNKALSSNARVHHMVLHKARSNARLVAAWTARAAPMPTFPPDGDIALLVTFEPPSRRGDRQNFPHLVKAYIDGVADAWGVNDKRFLPQYVYGEPVKGGRVTIGVA